MEYSKAQQLKSNRTKKKSKNFSSKVQDEIFERDGYKCVKCGSPHIDKPPHHARYKSNGGTGEKRNGVTVCRDCHNWAHHKCDSKFGEPSSEGKQWFIDFVDTKLDINGDYMEGVNQWGK